MPRDTQIEALMEVHNADLKNISEGIGAILEVQKKMQEELAGLRPIKEEWPVVKMVIQDTSIRLKKVESRLENVEKKVIAINNNLNDFDKKIAAVLPDHEKRITRLEAKPV